MRVLCFELVRLRNQFFLRCSPDWTLRPSSKIFNGIILRVLPAGIDQGLSANTPGLQTSPAPKGGRP